MLVALAGAGRAAPAQELVLDIGDVVPLTTERIALGPRAAVGLEGIAYFFADDGIHGTELWRSDGTPEGTHLMRDLCPGSCGATYLAGPRQVAATTDRVVFGASDGVRGFEPWITDGTIDGTHRLRDLAPGWRSSVPRDFVAAGGSVYFSADDGTGRAIWLTDGTEPGTRRLIADPPEGFPVEIGQAHALGSLLIFADPLNDAGLWRSDGSEAGTFRLATLELATTAPWVANAPLALLDDRLLFAGRAEGAPRATLWSTDGTVSGTIEIASAISPVLFAAGTTRIYFISLSEDGGADLGSTDGTPAGTAIHPLPGGARPLALSGSAATLGDRLVFVAGSPDTAGAVSDYEPWTTDGVTAFRLGDLAAGAASSIALDAQAVPFGRVTLFATLGESVLFFADDLLHGKELWRTDGTQAGTKRVRDLVPGLEGVELDLLQGLIPPARSADAILVRTLDPDGSSVLWRADSTPAGTKRIAVLNEQRSGLLPSSEGAGPFQNPPISSCWTAFDRGVAFAARDVISGIELWSAEPLDGGAELWSDLAPGFEGSEPSACRAHRGRLLLSARAIGNGALYAGDVPLAPLAALGPAAFDPAWIDFEGEIYFGNEEGLWRTDATAAGTTLEDPVAADVYLGESAVAGNLLFFGSTELWSSDGTTGGATRLLGGGGVAIDDQPYPARLTPLGEILLFVARDPAGGYEPWRSDGTPEGTQRIADIRPGPGSSIREELGGPSHPFLTRIVPLGALALFAADDGQHGEELWATDGTPGGAWPVADLAPGATSSSPTELTRLGGFVYFVAEAEGLGRELWRTDGTQAGTHLVDDLAQGAASSIPEHLTAAGSELYFSAWTAGRGREAWRLRATGASAFDLTPLPEIAPGPSSSSPEAFLEAGGWIFTVANDHERGFELWRLREDDVVFADGFEGATLGLWMTNP